MQTLSSRSLCGARFTVKPVAKPTVSISNGSKYFMRRKDSFMVEVNIAEDESEDSAVRRYMKQVVESKVIDHLRARRRMESKIEKYKRRQRERAEARKMGLVEPVWDELYGDDTEAKPFDEYFKRDEEELDIFEDIPVSSQTVPAQEDDIFDAIKYGNYNKI